MQPGLQARPELRVAVVRRVPLVPVLHLVRPEHLVPQEPQGRPELLVLPVQVVRRGALVLRVRVAHQVAVVRPAAEAEVLLDQAALRAVQVPMTTMMTMTTTSHLVTLVVYL